MHSKGGRGAGTPQSCTDKTACDRKLCESRSKNTLHGSKPCGHTSALPKVTWTAPRGGTHTVMTARVVRVQSPHICICQLMLERPVQPKRDISVFAIKTPKKQSSAPSADARDRRRRSKDPGQVQGPGQQTPIQHAYTRGTLDLPGWGSRDPRDPGRYRLKKGEGGWDRKKHAECQPLQRSAATDNHTVTGA